jgi:hypothetical protein
MTVQKLKIGKREFVLVAKRDFERLTAQAQRSREDEYWIQSALQAEAKAKAKKEKPVLFEQVERELDARKSRGGARGRGSRGRR